MAERTLSPHAQIDAKTQIPSLNRLDSDLVVIAVLIAHFGLGILVSVAPSFARPIYITIFAVGLTRVLLYPNKTYVTAFLFYVAGSEVFWRATHSIIFWESGKYLVLLTLIIEIFRYRSIKMPIFVFGYLMMLMPAAFLTLSSGDFFDVRELLAANLSGPIVLAMSIWFFSEVTINSKNLKLFLICLIAPAISMGVYALYGLLTNENLTWTTESNWQASGGFGPNQVSASFSLAITAIFILIVLLFENKKMKLLWIFLVIWITGQTLLTFSRGGIFSATVVIFVIAAHLLRRHLLVILILLFILLLAYQYLFPILDNYTDNQLRERFQDPADSRRGIIMNAELQLFKRNPFGVGVGLSKSKITNIVGFETAAHNEYSRLLAEHGVLGLIAMLLIGSKWIEAIFRAQGFQERALIMGFSLWSLINMYINATRIVAIPFIFGVAFAQFKLIKPEKHSIESNP
ncbi:MAG: O-antigen ligase family protein [Chloroflexi bacterium]|nr:O-antigen ligase family protein [Chloroflexota bacterium]